VVRVTEREIGGVAQRETEREKQRRRENDGNEETAGKRVRTDERERGESNK
jgi:hypothetical protein